MTLSHTRARGRACIVSILRLQTLYTSTTTTDPTWDKTPSGFYGVIEANLGIACACVVTLRPLFTRRRFPLAGAGGKPRQETASHQFKRCGSGHDVTLSTMQSTQVSHDSNPDVETGRAAGTDSKAAASSTAVALEVGNGGDRSPNES